MWPGSMWRAHRLFAVDGGYEWSVGWTMQGINYSEKLDCQRDGLIALIEMLEERGYRTVDQAKLDAIHLRHINETT